VRNFVIYKTRTSQNDDVKELSGRGEPTTTYVKHTVVGTSEILGELFPASLQTRK